jgi:hypothetical protein
VPVFRRMYYKTNGTTLFSLVTSSAAELFRKGYKVMPDHTRWIVQRQDNASSDFHIRLNSCHPGLSQATRLLSACGECETVEAAGIVYRFVSEMARDNTLHRLRFR